MHRVRVVSVSVVLMLGVLASPASAAEKFKLVGPKVEIDCGDLTPADAPSTFQDGFIGFQSNAAGAVAAVVSLRGAEPNTEYPVRLIQGSDDCLVVDGVLRTNRAGNGTLRVSEDIVTDRAQVIIDTGSLFSTPTYRAIEIFLHRR